MTVTVEEVTAAYRMLLDRAPSDAEAKAWLHVESAATLRRLFLASPEGQAAMRAALPQPGAVSPRLGQDLAANEVEWQVDPAMLAPLLQRVTATWTALGESEPHWSVLSADGFRAAQIEANAASFYASGAGDARRVLATLARHGLAPASLPRLTEYGCGVGRVTPFLAAAFAQVVAVDISETHLRMARDVAAAQGRGNVECRLARAPDFGMTQPMDVWFSHLVLQHNPPPVIALVLRVMFAALAPGGVAIFQLPTFVPGYRFDLQPYLASPPHGGIEMHALPQPAVFALAEAAGCVPLELREDLSMPYPWLSNIFVFRKRRA